jgi:hypothetical protein
MVHSHSCNTLGQGTREQGSEKARETGSFGAESGERLDRMIWSVELASFTFEFYEHLPLGMSKSLDPLAGADCTIERLDHRMFRVVCTNPYAHAFAGWFLYGPLAQSGRVIAANGAAEMDASAYKNLPTKYKTRKI